MKKYINRNYFWASLFVKQLEVLGIKNVCISPGSRNTPLTLAFALNKKIKKYVHIDERSSGFFALGLAKKTKQPVAIVTTSGTAVAELYPAIIEAYQQRVPLIVCTADRPSYLRNSGANQTINQENIFRNHIRKFSDVGLPQLSKNKLYSFCKKTAEIIKIATEKDKGPVHINFPFEKPLEPDSFTDNINLKLTDFIVPESSCRKIKEGNLNQVIAKVAKFPKTIILLGWDNFDKTFYKKLLRFSKQSNIPIFTDGTSDLRFFNNSKSIIVNHSSFFKSEIVKEKIEPDLILQFGNAPTSQTMLRFLEETKAKIILINEFGDKKNASKKKCEIVKVKPENLLNELIKIKIQKDKDWYEKILKLDEIAERVKNRIINKSEFNFEPAIVNELLKAIPEKSNLFISNSMPIRDYDFFASKNSKQINIFTNRGASGIDGIISTASGIASKSKNKNFLIIGDLAFYHNLNALASLNEFGIPLVVVLINNNGGGIFNMLPVASNKKYFEKYFITSQNLNYKKIVYAFGGKYFSPKSKNKLKQNIIEASELKLFSVIEIKTDSKKSLLLRKKYWSEIKQAVEQNDN